MLQAIPEMLASQEHQERMPHPANPVLRDLPDHLEKLGKLLSICFPLDLIRFRPPGPPGDPGTPAQDEVC